MSKSNNTVRNFMDDSGNTVEQFWLYDTLIAEWFQGTLYLSSFHDYSQTTTKHLNQYLDSKKPERMKAIKAGTIKLIESGRNTNRLSKAV